MKSLSKPASRFKSMIVRRFSVRLHMFVILSAVIILGLVSSRLLLLFGVTHLVARCIIVLCLSYAFFFIAIRIWLYYVLPSFREKDGSSGDGLPDIDFPSGDSASGRGGGAPTGGGGKFSGGGSSGGWDGPSSPAAAASVHSTSAPVSAALPSSASGCGSSGGGRGGSSDGISLDSDSSGALVVVVIVVVIAAILGSGIYLIYQAPVILSEAAFNALLSGGMARASKKMRADEWTGSVFKATWIPFAVIATVTLAGAAVLHSAFPGETNITDIVRHTLLK